MRKKLIGVVLSLLILIGAGVPIVKQRMDAKKPDSGVETPTKPVVIEETPKPEPKPQPEPTDHIKDVISQHEEDIYNDPEVIDKTYPVNLIPPYKVNGVTESNEYTTPEGGVAWSTRYGSDASIDDITAFYSQLIGEGVQVADVENGGKRISGQVTDYNVDIIVSPNNPERTGLNFATSVSMAVEEI